MLILTTDCCADLPYCSIAEKVVHAELMVYRGPASQYMEVFFSKEWNFYGGGGPNMHTIACIKIPSLWLLSPQVPAAMACGPG